MKLCGWCEKAPATTRYTAPELAGMYVSVCVPCLDADRAERRDRIKAEREAAAAKQGGNPTFEGSFRIRFLADNGGTRDPEPGEYEAQRDLVAEALAEGDPGERFGAS